MQAVARYTSVVIDMSAKPKELIVARQTKSTMTFQDPEKSDAWITSDLFINFET